MDIQEIREGVACQLFWRSCPGGDWSLAVQQGFFLEEADKILSYLAEKEACFPVEGELPDNPFYQFSKRYQSKNWEIYQGAMQGMWNTGYRKVITLKEMMG